MSEPRSIAIAVSLVVVGTALLAAPLDASSNGRPVAPCTKRANVEAIIDDSGSMAASDSNKLRNQALQLFINKSGNATKQLGAVEFGDDATQIFAPMQIGPNIASMTQKLDVSIDSEAGTTNYNAAFDLAKKDNASADARIFLTDGGHNVGTYTNGHQGGPPTYVIGFGESTSGEDGTRLQQIANETSGIYYPQTDSSSLQAVVNQVSAQLDCATAPTSFTDVIGSLAQQPSHAVALVGSPKTVDIDVTWSDPANVFDIVSVQIVGRGNKVVAKTAKAKKLKLDKKSGKTFLTLRVKNAKFKKAKKLKFKLKATTLAAPGAKVTSQVTQNAT